MMATRESEIGSPGHDGVVRRARGVQGGESRAPAAPWRVFGEKGSFSPNSRDAFPPIYSDILYSYCAIKI